MSYCQDSFCTESHIENSQDYLTDDNELKWMESNQFYQYSNQGSEISKQISNQSNRDQLTPKGNKKRSMNPMEAKNIPKNLGGLLKNYYNTEFIEISKNNNAVKTFMATAKKKKNLTREDFKKLFEDKVAGNIARQYFASFQIIQDILRSEKIPDISIHLKYIKKFFIATHYPESLSTLKLPE